MADFGPTQSPAAADRPRRPAERSPRQPRARDENVLLRRLIAVYSRLSGLASQDTDIATVTDLLAQSIGAGVAVVSDSLDMVSSAAVANPAAAIARFREYAGAPGLDRVFATAARTRRAVTLPRMDGDTAPAVIAPIIVGNEIPAYLLTFTTDEHDLGEDIRLLVTEHAAMICGVVLGRERVVAAAAGRARMNLIEGLLQARDRDDDEADRWAQHLGLNTYVDHYVIAIAVDIASGDGKGSAVRGGAMSLLESVLAARAPGAVVVTRDREVVAVVSAGEDTAASLARLRSVGAQCKSAVEERYAGTTVLVGVGGVCQKPIEIARSYAEARRAIDTVSRMRELGAVIAFDDLGIHRLLLRVPDVGDLRSFATEVLGDLLVHERGSGSELLNTLTVYFNENSSPQRTARTLHIHPNTVSYRIRRIEEIVGLSLNVYRDRLLLEVALEIVNALGWE